MDFVCLKLENNKFRLFYAKRAILAKNLMCSWLTYLYKFRFTINTNFAHHFLKLFYIRMETLVANRGNRGKNGLKDITLIESMREIQCC